MTELDDMTAEALELFLAGHHCSEVILTTVGKRRVKGFDPTLMRIATGFGGGIAEGGDVCGALVGAVMVIGLLHGRTNLAEDQTRCWELCRRYRERFNQELGSTSCSYFTGKHFNPETHRRCAHKVVVPALRLLVEVLDEQSTGDPRPNR